MICMVVYNGYMQLLGLCEHCCARTVKVLFSGWSNYVINYVWLLFVSHHRGGPIHAHAEKVNVGVLRLRQILEEMCSLSCSFRFTSWQFAVRLVAPGCSAVAHGSWGHWCRVRVHRSPASACWMESKEHLRAMGSGLQPNSDGLQPN